jgi:hypothetical protein
MEREPEEKNLFETAAETLGSKKKKKGKGSPPSEVMRRPVPDTDATKKKVEIPKVPQDPEISSMMGKIREMQSDLQSRFDKLYKDTGMDASKIKDFIDNPKNFLPTDWEFLQQNKKILEDKVWNAVGEELKPTHEKTIRTRANIADERKGKTLGSRKKWLPMR